MKKYVFITTLCLSFNTQADITLNNTSGMLRLSGDVEFNIDAASRAKQLTSTRTISNKNWQANDNERWGVNGRILLGLEGYQRLAQGNFSGFRVQPLADMSGQMNLDDAVFYFGNKIDENNNWQISIGRFEAYDMFPLNQDTFIEYSGNTANDLYADGFGYIYMMKEGRGRSNSGGNILLSKNMNAWYFEVNALVENGSDLFSDNTYHGNKLSQNKNSIYIRPVLSWRSDSYSTAVAVESNVINNAYGFHDETGQWHDQSQRNGFGWTSTLKPTGDITANVNLAYMNARNENDFTATANVLWDKFEIGYIWARNEIEQFNSAAYTDAGDFIDQRGKYYIHTIHTSYRFTNILDIKNFDIFLGAYWSQIERNTKGLYANENKSDERYGLRTRFKYYF